MLTIIRSGQLSLTHAPLVTLAAYVGLRECEARSNPWLIAHLAKNRPVTQKVHEPQKHRAPQSAAFVRRLRLSIPMD